MPRPPFIFARDTERTAIDRGIRDPGKRQVCYEMVEVVLQVVKVGRVTRADIGPILTGIEASDEAVWSRATGWLAKLHAFEPELSKCLDELAGHRSAAVRFHLCASLDSFQREVAVAYLRRFLKDKSARVRGTVPNVAVKAGYEELVPDFEAMLAEEQDEEQRKDWEQAIALLRGESYERDGMRVRKLPSGDLEYTSI